MSEEIQGKIRSQLISICHGQKRAHNEPDNYTYRLTIAEFWERMVGKEDTQRMAMAAEFLSHILLLDYIDDFVSASAFFNLEDKSFKKGFDIVLKNKKRDTVWITEIKSGEKDIGQTSSHKMTDLVVDAVKDLKSKFQENRISLWQNAINHLDLTMISDDEMKAVKQILMHGKANAAATKKPTETYNAIVVGCLFADLADSISFEGIHRSIKKTNIEFAQSEKIIFAFQKATYQKVVDFFEREAAGV